MLDVGCGRAYVWCHRSNGATAEMEIKMHSITVQTFGYDNETIGRRVALIANMKFATPVTMTFAEVVRAEGGIEVNGPDNVERDAICDKLTKVGVYDMETAA